MGSSPAEATRLFVTPAPEVEVICRLALAHYLRLRVPDAAWPIDALLPPRVRGARVSGAGRGSREAAAATLTALDGLKIVDPACGEGHFLMGMLDVLDELGELAADHAGVQDDRLTRRRRIVERNLYGVEVHLPAMEQARINLSVAAGLKRDRRSGLEGRAARSGEVRVCPAIVHGDSLVERRGFAWARSFPGLGPDRFDLVIGNPPYVRHEQISDPLGLLPGTAYKREVVSCVEGRLPAFFGASRRLDRRSDLSTLFTFLGLSLLRPGGALGFVLPAGTLDARYGRVLLEYLESAGLDSVILESDSQRSFTAGVNTVILTACSGRDAPGPIRQVSVAGPLYGLNLRELSRSAPPVIRVSPRQAAMRLLDRVAGQVTSLGSIGRLRYPVKTGINPFFYPTRPTVERFGIETEFCRPILRSPRSVRSIVLEGEDLETVLFACDRDLDELESESKRGALEYIRWGAEQRSHAGLPWPQVPSVQGRRHWYAVPLPPPADIICPRFFDRRFFFVVPPASLLEDQTFYGLLLGEEDRALRDALAAVLNSSLTYLTVELHGRTGLGDGVRQYALCDMTALPVPDVRSIPSCSLPELTGALERMAERPIAPIEQEVRRPDRLVLDAVVGDALGLSGQDMEDARDLLVELAGQRLRRARSLSRSTRATAS